MLRVGDDLDGFFVVPDREIIDLPISRVLRTIATYFTVNLLHSYNSGDGDLHYLQVCFFLDLL